MVSELGGQLCGREGDKLKESRIGHETSAGPGKWGKLSGDWILSLASQAFSNLLS